jgi:hypothetical protein
VRAILAARLSCWRCRPFFLTGFLAFFVRLAAVREDDAADPSALCPATGNTIRSTASNPASSRDAGRGRNAGEVSTLISSL